MKEIKIGAGVLVIVSVIILIFSSMTTIPAGHVGVKTLFGKVSEDTYNEGLHLINPLSDVQLFDARQKTLMQQMGVPSQDQLITDFTISIQYRLIKEKAAEMLRNTGTPTDVMNVHTIPMLRSQLREVGKSVKTAEEFFDQKVQKRVQGELFDSLSYLKSKGILVEKLLVRDVKLPKIITDAVERKKKAAQEAEKAKEELKKFKVDQERKEAKAEAEKRAEVIDAEKKKEIRLISANAELEAAKIDAQKMSEVLIINANAKQTAASIDSKAKMIRADAAAYWILAQAEAEAKANKQLSASVTDKLIRYKEAEAKLLWDGKQPNTLITGSQPNMLMQMN